MSWVVFDHGERDNKPRAEFIYPSGSLCLFLSHKQIFLLPVRTSLSHSASLCSLPLVGRVSLFVCVLNVFPRTVSSFSRHSQIGFRRDHSDMDFRHQHRYTDLILRRLVLQTHFPLSTNDDSSVKRHLGKAAFNFWDSLWK